MYVLYNYLKKSCLFHIITVVKGIIFTEEHCLYVGSFCFFYTYDGNFFKYFCQDYNFPYRFIFVFTGNACILFPNCKFIIELISLQYVIISLTWMWYMDSFMSLSMCFIIDQSLCFVSVRECSWIMESVDYKVPFSCHLS